ncbi:MAG: hypothetical protein C5B48_10055 [Candidatus Rokuibacteriota bacterium]|nr:MAG: hypothetical protein C5B48_10055 [Candidatus Rokubacteria bacterium]
MLQPISVLEFRVLGPLEVREGERVIELPPGKQRLLLAALLLRAGEIVATDTLIEQLWGERPPRTAKGALVNNVSLLRKALGPHLLLTRAPGYLLDLSPEQTDLGQFERLTADARATDSVDERAQKLREALALWRGAPFADLAFESFAQLEISRLEDMRLVARQDLIDAELALGRHADLLAELDTLVQQHPFDERLRGQQMLALYRAGRQADALEAYQTTRGLLDEELGLEPGGELKQLEAAILHQDPALATPAATVQAVEASRRTVTVLFADLVDSTALAERLDPEALQTVLTRYFSVMRDAVEQHGGTVEKFIGDAVMAVFGVPRAHEDDALRAVRTAVDMRDSVSGSSDGLELRIGVNTGEVVTGGEELLVTGATVNLAKRLEQAAPSGEILISAGTLRLVRHAVSADAAAALGAGNETPVPSFRLIEIAENAAALERRLEAPLVGRQEELAQLRQAFEEVCEQRRCRVVTVLGEAGMGKTRLILELLSSLEGTSVLVGHCASYGAGVVYLPLSEMVKRAGADFDALLADAASTGEISIRVREWLERQCAERPLVLVFEDLHWAEPTLTDLIDYLGETAKGPILCLCSARPEFQKSHTADDQVVVPLGPLPDGQVQELVDRLLKDDSRRLGVRIVEISEGNPLFAEQLVAYVYEEGAGGRLDPMPPSIEALLASRIDLLDTDDRGLLQRAAVIGRDFTQREVEALGPAGALPRLEGAGLVHRRGESFRFHHVLIRDVAYAGIPKTLRSALHECHAAWLVEHNNGSQAELDEIVGYHFEQAHRYRSELGQNSPAVERLATEAAARLGRAGIEACNRHQYLPAVALFSRATVLLPEADPSRPELIYELGGALHTSGDPARGEQVMAEAATAAKAAGDRRIELRIKVLAACNALYEPGSGGADKWLNAATTAIRIFERRGDERSLASTWVWISMAKADLLGRYAESITAAELAAHHSEKAGRLTRSSVVMLASALYHGPTPALEAIRRCKSLLTGLDRAVEANLLANIGGLTAMRGQFVEARTLVSRAKEIYRELDQAMERPESFVPIPIFHTETRFARLEGEIALLAGDTVEAEHIFRAGCEALDAIGHPHMVGPRAARLADVLYVLERYEEADSWTRTAEQRAAGSDVNTHVPWRTVRAKIMARNSDFEAAIDLAREAVTLGEQTDALTLRANAASDLAEVLVLAGREDEGVRALKEAASLYKQKDNLVMAERTRKRLAELSIATDSLGR